MNLSRYACLLTVVLASTTAPASAQCPGWSTQFGNVSFNGPVRGLGIADLGSGPALYAGGDFDTPVGSQVAHRVARWSNGAWSALGSGIGGLGSQAGPTIYAFAQFDDGSGPALFAGGSFTLAGGAQARSFAKWNGASWSEVGGGIHSPNGTDSSIRALTVFDDGSGPALFVGGSFTDAGGQPLLNIARWNGTSWSSLGDASAVVYALQVFDDGSGPALYAAGDFFTIGGVSAHGIAKWNGTSWSAVGSSVGMVDSLCVFDDGSGPALYAGGSVVWRWNGTTWTILGTGPGPWTYSLASFDDGSGAALYACGSFFSAGGALANHVARWNGSSWSIVAGGTNGDALTMLAHDDGWGSQLYVGGWFGTAGGIPASRLARFDGTSWNGAPGSQGIPSPVRAMTAFDDGSGGGVQLYAGGSFVGAGTSSAQHVAKWNGSTWAGAAGGTNGQVLALETWNGSLYAGGTFTQAGSTSVPSIARFDGTQWNDVGGGVNGSVSAIAGFDDGTGPALYVAGAFNSAGSSPLPAKNIARWDGSNWSDVGGGLTWTPFPNNTVVTALAVFDDGTGPALIAGGLFNDAGGTSVFHVARWKSGAWTALGAGLGDATTSVFALAVFDDGLGGGPALYAGGEFAVGSSHGVARWDGTNWTNVGVTPVFALALTVFDEGSGPRLFAAGHPAQNLARWDGSSWTFLAGGVGAGMSDRVFCLLPHDDGSGLALFAGGMFNVASGVLSGDVAKWQSCAETAVPFCFGDGIDPNLVPCPCANFGATGHGCQNSAGMGGAILSATGVPSLANDTVVLHASGELPVALSIFLQGDATIANGASFGDGIRCAGGHLYRLAAKNAQAGAVHYPALGDLTIGARVLQLGGVLPAGSARVYQAYYRDPSASFCPAPAGNTWNVTNAVQVVWY